MRLLDWGNSTLTERFLKCEFINHPDNVAIASNKLKTFNTLKGCVNIPEYTIDKEEATKWLATDDVVVRHVLRGHSGEGIEIVNKGSVVVPNAPLYVKYIPKKQEYRVHVGFGNTFFIQRKARDKNVDGDAVNWKIRNHGNGFIYSHIDVDLPEDVKRMCEAGIIKLGLDFGAVDLIYNEKKDSYYILEINTAPGLVGTTLEKYAQMFEQNLL